MISQKNCYIPSSQTQKVLGEFDNKMCFQKLLKF